MDGDDLTWKITENMSPGLLSLFKMDDKSNDKEIKIAWTAPIRSGLTNSEPIIHTPFNVSPEMSALPPMINTSSGYRNVNQEENILNTNVFSSNRVPTSSNINDHDSDDDSDDDSDLLDFFSTAVNESVAEFLDDVIAGKQNMSGDDLSWQITQNMSPGLLALFDMNPSNRLIAEKDSISAWQAPAISGLENSDPILPTAFNVSIPTAMSMPVPMPRSSETLSSSSSIPTLYPSPPVRMMMDASSGKQSTSSSYQRHYDLNGDVGVLVRRRSSNSNPPPGGSTSISILGGSQSTTTIETVAKDRDSEVGKVEDDDDGDEDDKDYYDDDDDDDDDDDSEEDTQRMMRDDEDEDAYADRILSMMSHNLKLATGVRVSDAPLESDWKPPSHAGLSNSDRIVSSLKY